MGCADTSNRLLIHKSDEDKSKCTESAPGEIDLDGVGPSDLIPVRTNSRQIDGFFPRQIEIKFFDLTGTRISIRRNFVLVLIEIIIIQYFKTILADNV